MADCEQQQQCSSSLPHGNCNGDELVLVIRSKGWGLPTACPFCLPAYVYLRMAEVDFSVHYNNRLPDSDDLPTLEYGEKAAFSSDTGGIIKFLNEQNIANLDAEYINSEVAELRSLSAMVESCLQGVLLFELWDTGNIKVVNQIYFSALPWPINKILHWKQQAKVTDMLGLNRTNWEAKVEELYRKAREAYEALSITLGERRFFLKSRPSSLDALFLSHTLFVLHVLEESKLKEELLKHENLVKYSETLQKDFIKGRLPPIAPNVFSSARTGSPSSYFRKSRNDKEPKERSEKDKLFKRRAKYFLAAQFAAVMTYVLIWGVTLEESLLELEDADGEE